MAVFDALRHLSTYLNEAHTSGKHHLADLYEIVQYAGNILVVSPDRPRPSPRVELTLLPLRAALTVAIVGDHPSSATVPDDHRRISVHVHPGRTGQGDHEGHDGDDPRSPAPDQRTLPPPLPQRTDKRLLASRRGSGVSTAQTWRLFLGHECGERNQGQTDLSPSAPSFADPAGTCRTRSDLC